MACGKHGSMGPALRYYPALPPLRAAHSADFLCLLEFAAAGNELAGIKVGGRGGGGAVCLHRTLVLS